MKQLYFIHILILFLLLSCNGQDKKQVEVTNSNIAAKLSTTEGTDLGVVYIKNYKKILLKIKNTGSFTATNIAVGTISNDVLDYAGDKYPGTEGTCKTTLQSGESCTIHLEFFATKSGKYQATLPFSYNDGIKDSKFSVTITATAGTAANLEVQEQTPINFGLIEPFSPKPITLTLKNSGTLTAQGLQGSFEYIDVKDNIYNFVGGSFPGTGGSCGSVLLPGLTCTITVEANAQYLNRESGGKVNIFYNTQGVINDFAKSLNVTLVAKSVDKRAVLEMLSAPFKDAGVILNKSPTDQPIISFSVQNVGYNDASNIQLVNQDNFPLVFDSTDCPTLLAKNAKCTLLYKVVGNFSTPLPNNSSWPYSLLNNRVYFTYNDGKTATPQITAVSYVSGTFVTESYLSLYKDGNPDTAFLANEAVVDETSTWAQSDWTQIVGTGAKQRTLILQNGIILGARETATNLTFTLTGNDDGALSILCQGPCPKEIVGGRQEAITIQYLPTPDTDTLADRYLTISYNTGIKVRSYKIKIQTKAVKVPQAYIGSFEANQDLQVVVMDMGDALANMTLRKQFYVLNRGVTPVTLDGWPYGLTDPAFTIEFPATDSCENASLANGAKCFFYVSFNKAAYTPPNPEVHNDKITITNGLTPGDPYYAVMEFQLTAKLVQRGYLVPTASPITIPVAGLSNGTLGITKYSTSGVGYTNSGTWPIQHAYATFEGPDAASFNYFSNSSGTYIQYTLPTVPKTATATMRWHYHGRGEIDGSPYDSADDVLVPVTASAEAQPDYDFNGADTNHSYDLGQAPIGEALSGSITLRNTGHMTQQELAIPRWAKVSMVNSSSPSDVDNFTISIPPQADCVVQSQNLKEAYIDIAASKTCNVNISFTSTGFGQKAVVVKLEYNNKLTDTSISYSVVGSGLNLAAMSITPSNTAGLNFIKLGSQLTNTSKLKEFTIKNAVANSADGKITGISLVSWGDNACKTATLSADWAGKTIVNGNDGNVFTIDSETCSSVNNILPSNSQCNVTVKFKPTLIDKVFAACLKVSYKRYTTDPTTQETVSGAMLVLGLVVPTTFNGWEEILAFGPNRASPAKISLKWRPMTVGGGAVQSYKIYRKKLADSNYPNTPLNASPILAANKITYKGVDVYEWNDTNGLQEKGVYNYKIVPSIKLDGDSNTYTSYSNEADGEVRVIAPLSYTNLIHRITANIRVCRDLIGINYNSLDRTNYYRCNYNGLGSKLGFYDLERDLIVDRYESGLAAGTMSNSETSAPEPFYKFKDASDYCSGVQVDIDELNRFGIKKRLLSRSEYMLATQEMSTSGCNVNSGGYKAPGRGDAQNCSSIFGVEDAIGNAWEYLSNELVYDSSSSSWKFSSKGDSGLNGFTWPFSASTLDLGDMASLYRRETYSAAATKCISEILGISRPDTAGTCATGLKSFSSLEASMNLVGTKRYMDITAKSDGTFGSLDPLTRELMVGGSYSSGNDTAAGPGVPASRWSMFWSSADIDGILYQDLNSSDPNVGNFQGGAARCIFEVGY